MDCGLQFVDFRCACFFRDSFTRSFSPNAGKKKGGKTAPALRVQATILSKSTGIVWRNSVGCLGFVLHSGERKGFSVNLLTDHMFQQGEEGILTYKEQGNLRVFLSFQPTPTQSGKPDVVGWGGGGPR